MCVLKKLEESIHVHQLECFPDSLSCLLLAHLWANTSQQFSYGRTDLRWQGRELEQTSGLQCLNELHNCSLEFPCRKITWLLFVRNLQRRVRDGKNKKSLKAIQNIPALLSKMLKPAKPAKTMVKAVEGTLLSVTELNGFMSWNRLWIDFLKLVYLELSVQKPINHLVHKLRKSCFLFVDLKFSRLKQIYSLSQQFWSSLNQEVLYSCICFLIMKINACSIKHQFLYQRRSNYQQVLMRLWLSGQ